MISKIHLTNNCLKLVSKSPTTSQCKRYLFKFGQRSKTSEGYYILFPDVPSDTPETNELLRIPTLESTTQFSKLNAEKCVKAVAKLSIDFESTIDSLEHQCDEIIVAKTDKILFGDEKINLIENFFTPEELLSTDLDEVIRPIEEKLVSLDFALSTFRTLRHVDKSRYNFQNFDQFFNRINGVKIRRFQSQQIYYFMREINSNRDTLNNQQKRVVDKYLLEAKLFGTHLTADDKHTLTQIHQELHKEKTEYRRKLDEATKRFTHTIDDPALLQVLPDELIASIGSHSNATVTLHSSVFNPFMEYCPDRLLRWNLWIAYNSRASPYNDTKISNSINIEQIRSLRRKQANVLGYENFAEMSMETKMAHNLDTVKAFITTLHVKNKPSFDSNFNELTDFAKNSGSFEADRLELWDLPYWQRKLLKTKYSIEDSAVKQYFPLDAVLKGMFELSKNVFNVSIEEVPPQQFDPWHKDVRLFRIVSDKGLVGSFFFDPYTRINEKSMGSRNELALVRSVSLDAKPVSYIISNLPKPLFAGHSTQLSFTQVLSLFKQFGITLQHSMSEIDYSEISGLSNLEWDVVHFIPEFFALWPLNSYKTIASCSNHVVDGSSLPESTFKDIRKAHYHFSSINLKHEIYRMALDLGLYTSTEFWSNVRDQVWDEFMTPFTRDKLDTHPCSFKAIFSDDFAAAYFSFKWAEMLAADAFGAFQEVGLDNNEELSEVGARFRDTFLKLSGGYNSNEVFRRFLGRDPSVDSFLRINRIFSHQKKDIILGMDKTKETTAEKHIN